MNKEIEFGIKASFSFPLQSNTSKKEVLIGAALLLIPIWGWIANLGHRIIYTHKLLKGEPPFPSWSDFGNITKHGLVTLAGMVLYHSPASCVLFLYRQYSHPALLILGIVLWIMGTLLVPGYMTRYCIAFDWRVIPKPLDCLKAILKMGSYYWRAWAFVLSAMAISFLGLLGFGLGFLITSVWFWQVAAYSFTSAYLKSKALADL
ncbi:MAG: hypothetical protein ACKVTZ_03855 [Bacteroidia bacterium]